MLPEQEYRLKLQGHIVGPPRFPGLSCWCSPTERVYPVIEEHEIPEVGIVPIAVDYQLVIVHNPEAVN